MLIATPQGGVFLFCCCGNWGSARSGGISKAIPMFTMALGWITSYMRSHTQPPLSFCPGFPWSLIPTAAPHLPLLSPS
jgi:hypothetical protein